MAEANGALQLYAKRILALAADIPFATPLRDPDGQARKRSPLCGSTVSVSVNTEDGRVSSFGQDVKACALGQASAAVLGKNVIGRDLREIENGRDQLATMLSQDGPPPDAPFEELDALRPAKDFKNRHASIMLAFEATIEAMKAAEAAQESRQSESDEQHEEYRQQTEQV